MDETTASIYTEQARQWAARREHDDDADARDLARRVRAGGIRVDLGCGPGYHLAALRTPLVALDVAFPMLELARTRTPGALAVQADLEALPFRRGALAGAFAAKSYLHVHRARLPLALAELHRSLEVGGPIHLLMRVGEGEGPDERSEFRGRWISDWDPVALGDIVAGAGFRVEDIRVEGRWAGIAGSRLRSLADTVGEGMRLLVCGLNPSEYAADAGVGFARPGNRFWPAARAAGLVHVDRDPLAALAAGLGMTDLVKRATPRADALDADEYASGLARLDRLVRWLKPGATCFVGLAGWRAAVDPRAARGEVEGGFAGRPAWLMPSTSGANASSSLEDLTDHLRAAAALADATN